MIKGVGDELGTARGGNGLGWVPLALESNPVSFRCILTLPNQWMFGSL